MVCVPALYIIISLVESGYSDSICSETRLVIIFVVFLTLVLRLNHMVEAIIVLARVLHVEVVSGSLLLAQDSIEKVLQDSPTVRHLQVKLMDEGLRLLGGEANDLMRLAGCRIDTLYEGEAHLVDAAQDALNCPSAHLVCVVDDLRVQLRI